MFRNTRYVCRSLLVEPFEKASQAAISLFFPNYYKFNSRLMYMNLTSLLPINLKWSVSSVHINITNYEHFRQEKKFFSSA